MLETDCDALGFDYGETLRRFAGSDVLLRRFLCRFPEDVSFAQLEQALADGRWKDAFLAAHTLKGVAASLGLSRLYEAVSPLAEALRAGRIDLESPLLAQTRGAYAIACRVLGKERANAPA